MAERKGLRSFAGSVLNRFSEFVRAPHYYERYIEPTSDYPAPIKENYRDQKRIGAVGLCFPLSPRHYLDEEFIPSFAEGRCLIIGGGDYKTVVADRDGNSEFVIKFYGSHIYKGTSAEEKARAAAEKIRIIHEIAQDIAPGFILPTEMIVSKHGEWFQVYERQQRALFIPIDMLNPKTAERLNKKATEVVLEGTQRVEEELLKRGLSRRSLLTGTTTDHLAFTEIHWDFITNHLVSLDFVDRVDIEPLLPPHLKSNIYV